MLKIESIKLPPGAGMAELTGAAARLLRVREKDLTDLRVLRRSVDAREDVALVYTVAAAVKDEGAVLRRCRPGKAARVLQAGGLTVNLDERTVTADGERVALTFKEFELLKLLLSHHL